MSFEQDLAAHIEPTNTRRLLTLVGLYLVAYELVNSGVIDGVRGFFSHDWEAARGWIVDEQYRRDVTAGYKTELDGCINWLTEANAITPADADAIQRLRNERNRVAHEINAVIVDPSFRIDREPLIAAADVLKHLAIFFGGITIDTDEQFDGQDVDREGIESGSTLVFSHVLAAFFAEYGDHK